MQVYAREEVESVWFVSPTSLRVREPYVPHVSGLEAGGAIALQTWAETETARRHLLILSLHGGLTVIRQGGLELDGDFTLPLSGRSDPVWRKYEPCYQVVMNVIVHPFVLKNGMVPFILGGGGASVGVPVGDAILSSSTDIRNLVDVGFGLKWGSNGLGYRLEWRHHFYTWTPDETTSLDSEVRASEQTADASVFRATLFIYR